MDRSDRSGIILKFYAAPLGLEIVLAYVLQRFRTYGADAGLFV